MRNWRVVRVRKDGHLHVAEQQFWTKKGAQATATHLNTTFGALVNFAGAMLGHNFFATSVDRIPMIEQALENARKEQK